MIKYKFQKDKRVLPLLRLQNHGLAESILDGIKKSSGGKILIMDSDFNHNPNMIWQMFKLLEFYDIVVGSRFVYSGGMEDTLRNKFSYLYNLLVRIILGTHIQDNLSGFFIIRRPDLSPLCQKEVFHGYGEYFLRLLYRAKLRKYQILEVPVYYNLRRHGESKSNFIKMILIYTLTMVTELSAEVRRRKSLKVIFNK